jgi:hypothetical protein
MICLEKIKINKNLKFKLIVFNIHYAKINIIKDKKKE